MPVVEPARPSAARRLRRGTLALTAVGAAVAGLLIAPDAAAAPLDAGAPGTVTADGLPTVQINGVAWDQVVVGNTVYVAGSFTSARPAGAPLGTGEVPRENLLAYDIRTGELVQGFHHALNNDATTIAASPDGTRIYVGGKFTSVDGVARYRLAAFDVATGDLVTGFKPVPSSAVSTVAVTAGVVYFGGAFNNVNGVSRTRAAAVNLAGALLPWAPTIDNYGINTMVVTPDRTGVVLGGRFSSVNGQPAFGSTAVDAGTGATRPWALNQTIKGSNTAGTLTLETDGTLIYGGNYTYGNGNFEGTWAADPTTGAIVWANDCLGDTYSAVPISGVVYTATHAHSCAAAGYFPETNPRTWNWALAYDTRTGTRTNTGPDAYGNNFSAYKTSEMMQWFPKLAGGSYTGQGQAAWSVAGNADYVVYGGEFPTVNGVGQQGLVRFAAHALAPNAFGPGAMGTPTASSRDNDATTSTVTVSAIGAYDRDDASLTYELFRTGITAPVATTTAPSTGFWTTQPTVTLVDPSAPRDATPGYRLVATDPGGRRSTQSFSVSTTTPPWVARSGAVSSAAGYQTAVGTTTLAGRTLSVPFTATGGFFLPRPDGSCVKSGATVVRPTSIALSTSQWGRYVGTATYTLPASGTYGFQYGCRGEFSTPVIGVATLPAA